jgi:hypothetical protein
MRKRSMGHALRVLLAAAALIATAMALYVQVFERRSRQEEDRLAAARLASALDESRARLKTEILAELRDGLATGRSPGEGGAQPVQPLPNAVLRRSESARDRALQQVLPAESAAEALARMEERLDSLSRQVEQSDRTRRQDLEEIRAEARREQDVTARMVTLLLAGLIAAVLYLLASLLTEGREAQRDEE